MHQSNCRFVPDDLIQRWACDTKLAQIFCENAEKSARLSQVLRGLRQHTKNYSDFLIKTQVSAQLNKRPEVSVFDCKQTNSLPGVKIKKPASSQDETVKRTYTETEHLANFLLAVFKRNSIDNAEMSIMSSVHYGKKYNNAMWTGQQMVYGDGDDEIFIDFSLGTDAIGHDMAHGLTQYTLQLDYDDEPGGLNESVSDCFGSMFRQWRLGQDSASADWLIGKEVLGPAARQRSFTCLRDMSDPGGKHSLAPQPSHYSKLKKGIDPHYTSGPPNLAFCTACKQVGGNSWETIGKIWYHVMTHSGPSPRMSMAKFSGNTRQAAGRLFGTSSAAASAVDAGWKKVGL